MDDRVTIVSRRLRDLCEPIAACVYFAPEATKAYEELGLDYAQGYFCSRSACLGRPSGEVVAAAFGVFNPAIVIPATQAGWSKTDPETLLDIRLQGATSALRRMLGDIDPEPAVRILRPVMESVDLTGRTLFAGLRSLPYPEDPIGQLWRVCDYVRERRGDSHNLAWVLAGLNPVEITLLSELFWGVELGSYVRTRGWPREEIETAVAQLADKGYVHNRAFTLEGETLRRRIELDTDRLEEDIVNALGEEIDELFRMLEPWARAILDAGGYPFDPSRMSGHRG